MSKDKDLDTDALIGEQSSLNATKDLDTKSSPIVLEDAYGKLYPSLKELNIARYKQMNDLYESIEGLHVIYLHSTRSLNIL